MPAKTEALLENQTDLREIERVAVFQERIDRSDQRLHGVVEEMREADAGKYDVDRPRSLRGNRRCNVGNDDRFGQGFIEDDDRFVQRIIP